MKRPLAVLVVAALAGWIAPAPAQTHDRLTPVPQAFFGLTIHRVLGAAWPQVPFGSLRIWDSGLNWINVEPQQGQFAFDVFDKLVDRGTQNGKQMVYTLGQTPRWASVSASEKQAWGYGAGGMPKDIEFWKQYVAAVTARYKGRIAGYEVWNEPKYPDASGTCKGAIFFCGSADDLVLLTKTARDIIKSTDPAAVLASPAFSGGIPNLPSVDRYLAAGAGPYLDALAFHFYELDPEAAWKTVTELRKILAKYKLDKLPIWNSEVGYLIQNDQGNVKVQQPWGVFSVVFSPEAAAGRMARTLFVAASAGLDRVFWYAWDDNNMGSFQTADGQATPLGRAYATVEKWLVGSTLSCGPSTAGASFHCDLQRNGRKATVLWDKDLHAAVPLHVPGQGNAMMEPLLGAPTAVAGGASVAWDGLPVLFTGDGKPWTLP